MKNFIKQISLTIVFLIFVTAFNSVAASAAGVNSDLEFMSELLKATGSLTESSDSDRVITRAEMALNTILLSGSTTVSSIGNSGFYDLPEDHEYYTAVNMAAKLGYVETVDIFNPDTGVTIIEASKMLLVMLGYKQMSESKGGYPYGYIASANSVRLLSGLPSDYNRTLTYNGLIRILYNALNAEFMQITGVKDGYNAYTSEKNVTLLNVVYKIYKANGQMVQNRVGSVNSDAGGVENQVKIGNNIYKMSATVYNKMHTYLGYYIDFYYHNDGESTDRNIVCFSTENNAAEKIFIEDITNYSNGVITYKSANRNNTVSKSIPMSASVLYNGSALTTPLDYSDLEPYWGDILMVDAGNSGKTNLVVIKCYENYFVSAIDNKEFVVYDANQTGARLDLGDNGKLKDGAVIRNKAGQPIGFDGIAKGAVLSAAKSKNGKNIEVYVVNDKVIGMVDSISEEDNDTYIFVDGNEYKVAPNVFNDRNEKITVGKSYTFGLDYGGRIAYVDGDTASGSGYVFLIDAAEKTKSIDGGVQLKIMDSKGNAVVVMCNDKVLIDGITRKASNDIISALSAGSSYVVSQPIEISVNDDGCVVTIDTPYVSNVEDPLNSLQLIYTSNDSAVIFKNNSKTFMSYCGVSPSAKVFLHPADGALKGDDDLYKVRDLTYFANDNSYKIKAYAKNKNSMVADIVSVEGNDSLGLTENSMIFLVDRISQSIDEDGEAAWTISGFYNGASASFEVENKDVLTNSLTNTGVAVPVGKGDSVRLGMNSLGKVAEIKIYYDCSADKPYTLSTDMDTHSVVQVVCGPLFQYTNGFLTLYNSFDINDPAVGKRIFTGGGYKIYLVEGAKENPTVRIGSISDLKDAYTFGGDCSKLLIQTRYYDARTLVIYQ